MKKFKSLVFSVIVASASCVALAQPTAVYTPNYQRHFDPIFNLPSLDSQKFRNQYENLVCTPADCEAGQIILTYIHTSMRQGISQGENLKFKIPRDVNGYVNIPPVFNRPHHYKGHGEAEFYYQALTYSPFVRGYEMSYQDALQAKASIDKKLQDYIQNVKKSVHNQNQKNANIPNTLNEQEFLTIFEASMNNLRRRQKVVEFMLSNPDAFNNYKNAFQKFYTVQLPFPEENFQPKIKKDVLKNAKLSAYECQFLNVLEDFKTLQEQNKFSCSK